jgi:hypothetical protein
MPALVEAKVRLYEIMRASKVNKSELARRMDIHLPQVDRLLEMKHGSKLDQVEAEFAALGKRLVVSVSEALPASEKTLRAKRRSSPRAARAGKRRVPLRR